MAGSGESNARKSRAYRAAKPAPSEKGNIPAADDLAGTAAIDQFEAYLEDFRSRLPAATYEQCRRRVRNARLELPTSARSAQLELTLALNLLCAALGLKSPL